MTISVDVDAANNVTGWSLTGIGDLDFLNELDSFRGQKVSKVEDLAEPAGRTSASLMFRELVLRVKNKWQFPYDEGILCHCRGVPTVTVDQAILAGAHTPEEVSDQTSASTACGTCRMTVEQIIKYRRGE